MEEYAGSQKRLEKTERREMHVYEKRRVILPGSKAEQISIRLKSKEKRKRDRRSFRSMQERIDVLRSQGWCALNNEVSSVIVPQSPEFTREKFMRGGGLQGSCYTLAVHPYVVYVDGGEQYTTHTIEIEEKPKKKRMHTCNRCGSRSRTYVEKTVNGWRCENRFRCDGRRYLNAKHLRVKAEATNV